MTGADVPGQVVLDHNTLVFDGTKIAVLVFVLIAIAIIVTLICFQFADWFRSATNLRFQYYYYYFFTPVLGSQGMKKSTLCNTKKYKNQAGMNLTPPHSQKSCIKMALYR